MESLGEIFHHGLIVDDLAAAMARVGAAAGTEWTAVRKFDPLPVWTPDEGRGEIRLTVAYSCEGPLRIELVESVPGTPYDRLRAFGRSHLGVWVESVGAAVETLLAQGWHVLVAGAGPRHGYGSMAYLGREGSPVIELVGTELRGFMAEWWATRP
ncbi:VOC family protein [Novosphingobium flavum]|uniref:VOC family protein n=1 Tax=Novosphingobium aerophilum TaxID=2839843 RepID=A0A7X1KDJ1_9SPHN|nr:VOC family protein [Novosphingobium aerophilum]MBC2653420.1 VOC family protein [Novosphingobium aerophilum]MBC2661887.1 VOC family protein [Novosphingobium aerophilum]